jgi:hypothetical protein
MNDSKLVVLCGFSWRLAGRLAGREDFNGCQQDARHQLPRRTHGNSFARRWDCEGETCNLARPLSILMPVLPVRNGMSLARHGQDK